MWYTSSMTPKIIEADLKAAKVAIQYARDVRATHRKRTERKSPQRQADLAGARERIRLAMIPIRSHIGRAQYAKESVARENLNIRLDKCSKALQGERRRLWKMMNDPKNPKKKPAPQTQESI